MKKYVFHKRELQRKFDFFALFRLQERKQLITWFFASIILFALVALMLSVTHVIFTNKYAVLWKKQAFLDKRFHLLQLQAKNRNAALVEFLCAVSDAIAPHTYLDSIFYENGSIEIEGYSGQIAQAVDFCKKLSETEVLRTCQWTYVQQNDLFKFRIRGKLA